MIRLRAGCRDEIREHGRLEYPQECCGLVLGRRRDSDGLRWIHRAERVENLWSDPARRTERFLVSPQDLFRVSRKARRLGLEVLGLYHSHPDRPARPSQADSHLARWSGLHAILSVWQGLPGELTWWCSEQGDWRAQSVEEVPELLG